MKTLAIASAKGGCGKSTITSSLAVYISTMGGAVCMLDLNDDQGNLSQWHYLRGQPDNPRLLRDLTNIPRDVRGVAASHDFLLVDTPPNDMDVLEQAVVISDAVLMPVRASMFDVAAVESVVELAQQHGKPWGLVMSAVDSRFKPLNAQAATALAQLATRNGGRLLGTRISHRMQYVQAIQKGKAGLEVDAEIYTEITGLWAECKQLLRVS